MKVRKQGLIVDSDSKIISQTTMEALMPFSRRLKGEKKSPWHEEAKTIYRVFVVFIQPNGRPSAAYKRGTAVHIGGGLFLTAAHVLQFPTDDRHRAEFRRFKPQIFLRGGSGVLDFPEGRKSSGFSAKVFAYPTQIESAVIAQNTTSRPLLAGTVNFPREVDFAILKAQEPRWLAKFRHALNRRPHATPASDIGLPGQIPINLLTIHTILEADSPDAIKGYNYNVNTVQDVEEASYLLLPGTISISSATATRDRWGTQAAVGERASGLRYRLSCTPGTSGGGLFSDDKKLLGIHFLGEVDEGSGNTITRSDANCGVAVAFSSPHFRDLVRDSIVPEFERLKLTDLVKNWGPLGEKDN